MPLNLNFPLNGQEEPPFSNNGGTSQVISYPEVATFANLPEFGTHLLDIYVVVFPSEGHPRGFYQAQQSGWEFLGGDDSEIGVDGGTWNSVYGPGIDGGSL